MTPRLSDLAYGAAGRAALHARKLARMAAAWAQHRIGRGAEARAGLDVTRPLSLNVCNVCNARCTFCAYRLSRHERERMPAQMADRCMDEYASLGGRAVDFTPMWGDPLLHPKLPYIVFCARLAGMSSVGLTTNGIRLAEPGVFLDLAESGLTYLNVSVGDFNGDLYARVFGVPAFERVLDGLRTMLDYNAIMGHPVEIAIRVRNAAPPSHTLRSPLFQQHIAPHLSKRVRVSFTAAYDDWCGTLCALDMVGVMRLARPLPELRIPCASLWTYAVLPDGAVRMCGCRCEPNRPDPLVIGNVNDEPLAQIARGERAQAIVRSFYEGARPEACRRCSMYDPIRRQP